MNQSFKHLGVTPHTRTTLSDDAMGNAEAMTTITKLFGIRGIQPTVPK